MMRIQRLQRSKRGRHPVFGVTIVTTAKSPGNFVIEPFEEYFRSGSTRSARKETRFTDLFSY